ncbi:MAG: HXXEE domain-containing protein [bacterium]|nr:HXXEE domain-containing protein [bacterium]
MNEIIWLFPILFILHDMEEIIGLESWLKKNMAFLEQKFPKISKTFQQYSTRGMAAAVMEELILCIAICVITRFTGFYGLWLGTFLAYTFHLVVHLFQSIVLKKYIPAVITGMICLPISIWLLVISIGMLHYPCLQVILYGFIGIVIIAGNLKIAHWIMHK